MMPSPTLKQPVKVSQAKSIPVTRVASIDIVRALTMVLMIFVNDLWIFKKHSCWLEHVEPGVDGIGLADVVFPAFLFIVGLSLPFAVENRRKKGDTELQLVKHVLVRTIALLVMGVFLVNGETINETGNGHAQLRVVLAFLFVIHSHLEYLSKECKPISCLCR